MHFLPEYRSLDNNPTCSILTNMNTFIDTPVLVTLQHCWEAVKIFGPVGLLLILATLLTIGGNK